MTNNNSVDNDVVNSSMSHTLTFSYKSIFEHFLGFIKVYPKRIPKMVALFISVWALLEIVFTGKENILGSIIIPLAIGVFVISLYDNVINYSHEISESLVNESKIVKELFFKQRLGWQYLATKEMLNNRIIKYELALNRIRKRAEFIRPRLLDEVEFAIYMKEKPSIILRLIEATKVTCIEILPEAISRVRADDEVSIKTLCQEIHNISYIYEQTVEFEKQIFEVEAPEEFIELNELMKGWTDPIRDGINQFIKILDVLSKINRKRLKNLKNEIPEFKIVFNPISTIDEFNKLLEIYNATLN